MIVVNKKLAKEALANAINSGRVNATSSPHAFLLQSLISLNFIFEVKNDPSLFMARDFSLDSWSGTEVATADTINWLLAFLEQLNCDNIEQLLSDVSGYRTRHPDFPKGAWPYVKGPR
ncbi:MAG: hypothetical protein HUK14_06180 [Muribaculaceae bacterium]|nr:hypothetical protein [Muribaculaceae bacterium]